mmetsp:Transcript_19513/g.42389  ORF Transcript_19513/g.42389 Transcript_19513/m.42389 type:complete len:320 (+) Transcript_19513:2-961(+)
MQSNSRAGGGETAAASILQSGQEQCDMSITSFSLNSTGSHNMDMQSNSRAAGGETAAAAASISRSGREQSDMSITSVSSFSLNSTGSSPSFSVARMNALEKIFVNASRNMTSSSGDSRSQTFTREHSKETVVGGSFAEGLEDMSLPSMSIGEISDFTPAGDSLSRSKRSGMDDSVIDSGIRHALRQEGTSAGTGILSHERNRGYDVNRNVSLLGSEHRNRPNAAAAAPQHNMRYAHAMQQQQTYHPSHYVHSRNSDQSILSQSSGSKHSTAQKKQRRSLSSYYRDLRAADAAVAVAPGDCPSTMDSNDAMSSIVEDGPY